MDWSHAKKNYTWTTIHTGYICAVKASFIISFIVIASSDMLQNHYIHYVPNYYASDILVQ